MVSAVNAGPIEEPSLPIRLTTILHDHGAFSLELHAALMMLIEAERQEASDETADAYQTAAREGRE